MTKPTSTAPQPRVLRGDPSRKGGEWRETELQGGAVVLEGLSAMTSDMLAERRALLAENGYVPAVATQAVVSPHTTARRADFWDSHFAQAEYAGEKTYAQMPDDFTPKMTSGRALSGHRRTHRMRYDVGGVTVRMPSKTSIDAYSRANGDPTFDVPVTAALPGGQEVQGWVRVTRTGPGTWHTSEVGFPPQTQESIAESVAATLESRAPSLRPVDYAALIEQRKARLAAQGDYLQGVDSTWIESIGYDDSSGTMAMLTQRGDIYGYTVPKDSFDAVAHSHSPGSAYNAMVKGTARVPVAKCGQCGRFYAGSRDHVCPNPHKAPSGPNDHTQAAMGRLAAARPVGAPPAPSPAPTPAPVSEFDGETNFDVDGAMRQNFARSVAAGRRRSEGTKFGPTRGWMRGVARAFGRATSRSHVPGAFRQGGANGSAGTIHYSGLGAADAAEVLKSLPPEAGAVRQGAGPTTATALTAVTQHPGKVEVGGYLVGPDRDDERVVVGSVAIFDDNLRDPMEAMVAARNTYGLSDATQRPREIRQVEMAHRRGEKAWLLSW